VSIQSYVFASNKLKDNIGASYIIEEQIYKTIMVNVLRKQFSTGNLWEKWNNEDEKFEVQLFKAYSPFECEIAYIGGGNAMLLFKNDAEVIKAGENKLVTKFIREYTLELLQRFPGLKTAFGINLDFNLTSDQFKESRQLLIADIGRNKNCYHPNVSPVKHGIVEDCPLSNEAEEELFHPYSQTQLVSKSSVIKMTACDKSQDTLENQFIEELRGLKGAYTFTDDLEMLGQLSEKAYIAIVHVDGNGIGKRFVDCEDLPKLRELSKQVSELADRVMKKIITHIVKLIDNDKLNNKNGFEIRKISNKLVLPLRPLITAGDDFTFICHGKLGVHLAEKLILFMNEERVQGKPVAACGGVAIIKTHYPFYRAYTLAEELMKAAKKQSRDNEGSWLSFMISSGGFSGNLENIIHQQFTTPNGILTASAYRVDEQASTMSKLKLGIKELFTGSDAWPTNKVMQLRDVLRQDEFSQTSFITETSARQLKLPEYEGHSFHKKLWENKFSPYYDIIELKDFYPDELL